MEFLTGYTIIPISALIGAAASYSNTKDPKSKPLSDHLKVAIFAAVLAGIVVFLNSGGGEGLGDILVSGGAAAAEAGKNTLIQTAGSSVAAGASSAAKAGTGGVVRKAMEQFATGPANF